MYSRQYENEIDDVAMRAMLVDAWRIAGCEAGYWHIGAALAWRTFLMSFRVDLRANIRLWFADANALVGFAVFGDDFSLDWQLHPAHSWRGIEEEMLAWGEARWREAMADSTIPTERKRALIAGALATDVRRCEFLTQHGFTREEHPYLRFARTLDDPIAVPTLPQGFSVRGVAGENEITNRASAHREAFHPSRVTDEGSARLMRMRDYDRELDVVAVAPEGTLAAYAMTWLDVTNQVGEFEPVGTRPSFQRRGLARAVLLQGMRRLRERGANTVLVCTGSANENAIRLYESVGFRVVNQDHNFVRQSKVTK